MAQGDSLKRYKMEQKEQTRKNIKEAITRLKETSQKKITVSAVAKEVGLTRAALYANYQDLLLDLNAKISSNNKKIKDELNDKDEVITKLRKDNKDLKTANSLLMDQMVALKKMLNNS